jgi:predicted dehydrogenase
LGFIGGADQVSGDAIGQLVSDLDGTHVDAVRNHPRVDLIAGSSRDEGRRERFHGRYGVPVFADWERMLHEAGPFDLVCNATYTPVHAEITLAAVEAGARVVYCEKPVAATIGEAEMMLTACRDAGALLVINHNLRFHPGYRQLRDRIAGGDLGTLTSASIQWTSGRLGNVGTHMIDAVQMVTGLPVTAVSGTLDLSGKADCRGADFTDPGGWGLLRLGRDQPADVGDPSGDLICTVDAADYGTAPLRHRFHGTEGYAICRNRDIEIVRSDDRETWLDDSPDSGMDRTMGEIVDWLDGAGPFSYDAAEAVRTLEAILAFRASHGANGAWVQLPLTGADRDLVLHSG